MVTRSRKPLDKTKVRRNLRVRRRYSNTRDPRALILYPYTLSTCYCSVRSDVDKRGSRFSAGAAIKWNRSHCSTTAALKRNDVVPRHFHDPTLRGTIVNGNPTLRMKNKNVTPKINTPNSRRTLLSKQPRSHHLSALPWVLS